jgi:hypothetical protein
MPELKEQLQRTLGDNYSLERELGGGGMSRVFVAEELSLGRKRREEKLSGLKSHSYTLGAIGR